MSPIPDAGMGAMRAPATSLDELTEPPVVRSVNGVAKFELTAAQNPTTGLQSFEYEGVYNLAPTISIKPGDTIEITLKNELPENPPPDDAMPQPMATGMIEYVNLHFHGLTVSPKRPGDDVLTMLASPDGGKLHYVVHVPATQQPGLYWYHAHVHGVTNTQVGNEQMSGAIVIEGLERHIPALGRMKQRVIMLRDPGQGDAVPNVRDPNPCGPDPLFTVNLNGQIKPVITIAPGEQQFFRLVNASGHKTLKLAVDGEKLQLVAVDGYALDAFPGTPATRMVSSIVVPPAGRAEFVVTGPASGHGTFRTLCYDSGFNGDPDPNVKLARLEAPQKQASRGMEMSGPLTAICWPAAKGGSQRLLAVGAPLPRNAYTTPLPPIAAKRTVVFSEGPHRFYINGKTFRPDAPPMFVVHTGTVEEWHIYNVTGEVHDFHIHQVHFYVESINGVKVAHPYWSDSFVVPHRAAESEHSKPGEIVAIMDFRDPVIKGTFLFHCHILDHEDHGMMAKIQAI